MLVTTDVGVSLIENSTGREAVNAGLRAGALHSQQWAIIERSRVSYVLFSWSLNQAHSLLLHSWSRCHSCQAQRNFTSRQTSTVIFSLLFGFSVYSSNLQAKQAHQFTSPSLLLVLSSCPCLQEDSHLSCVWYCNPVWLCVLCRQMLESGWIAIWMNVATAARTVGVVTATAVATTCPWVASTHGHTTTKEVGSSVR